MRAKSKSTRPKVKFRSDQLKELLCVIRMSETLRKKINQYLEELKIAEFERVGIKNAYHHLSCVTSRVQEKNRELRLELRQLRRILKIRRRKGDGR